jgi:hypothetical protein
MNKKYIVALIAAVLIAPSTAKATAVDTTPSLAILDTGLQSSLPIFQGKIAQEVCILDWNSCQNGTKYQEGPGAASLPYNIITRNGFDHGTQMASIAIATNPNMKIVFIRIIGNTSTGGRQLTYESTIAKALDWVAANKEKYNIKAVSMSQGHHNLLNAIDYCPKSFVLTASIKNLISFNVPTFMAAGNGRDYKRIDWPACINDVISVGATDQVDEVTRYSNYDPLRLDFYALGNTTAYFPDGQQKYVAGTSASTQIAASQWIMVNQAKPTLTYTQQYDLMKSTSKKVLNFMITGGDMIDVMRAING